MRELYDLKDKVYDELKNYGKKDLSASTLNTVKDLTKTAYYLCELIESEEEGGYSERANYENRYDRSYAGGRGGNSRREMRRESRRESRRNSYDGYSSHGDMMEELREMMDDAPDERTRQELMRFIQKMENN